MPTQAREFAQHCCDLLASVGPCVAKRMFGGYGISINGLTMAIVADLGAGETLWLKADTTSKAQFEEAGCQRFVYAAKGKTQSMNYYSTPDAALESAELMLPWARLALQAALRARHNLKKPRNHPAH